MPIDIDFEFLAGAVDGLREEIMKVKQPKPLHRTFAVAQTISASPTCIVLNSMFPAAGRWWELTDIGVYGADGHTAVTGGIADMYIGPSTGTEAPGDMASFIISSSIPTTSPLIGDKKAWGNPGDRIYAWIYGITVATQITLAGSLFDWRIEDRTEMVI